MNILEILKDPSAKWEREPPAGSEVIQETITKLGVQLPEDYITLLGYSNGGEGELGVEPGWFYLWSVEKLLEYNKGYNVEESVPGFIGFGSNGGGEMLAFDMRGEKPWNVVMIPFIGMKSEEVILIADDFNKFVRYMGKELGS